MINKIQKGLGKWIIGINFLVTILFISIIKGDPKLLLWLGLVNVVATLLILYWKKAMFSLRITKREFGLILITYFLVTLTTILINLLVEIPTSINQTEIAKAFSGDAIVPMILSITIVAPFLEEIFFRGIFQEWIEKKAGKVLSVAISTFIFAAVHMVTEISKHGFSLQVWIGLIPYLLSGLSLAIIYAKTEKLGASIWLHFLNNALAAVILTMGALTT